MSESAPSIVLVGDEPLTWCYLRRLLQGSGFDVRAEAGDAETGIELCLRESPARWLVDGRTAGGGIRVVREVSQKVPETRVVVLSGNADRNDMIDVIRAGASGYLVKSMDPQRIPAALNGELAGESAIPRIL